MEKFDGGKKQVEKFENKNNGRLIKRRRSGDYTRCLIGPSMTLLVGSLVGRESRWRS